MLTLEKFDNWLYDRDAPVTTLLCHGIAPEKLAEKVPEFAQLLAKVQHWCNIGYVNLERDGDKWMLFSRLVPNR